jgi:hypothetical protein
LLQIERHRIITNLFATFLQAFVSNASNLTFINTRYKVFGVDKVIAEDMLSGQMILTGDSISGSSEFLLKEMTISYTPRPKKTPRLPGRFVAESG